MSTECSVSYFGHLPSVGVRTNESVLEWLSLGWVRVSFPFSLHYRHLKTVFYVARVRVYVASKIKGLAT